MNRNLLIGILFAGAVSIGTLFSWPAWQDYQIARSQVKDRELELSNRETYFQDLRQASDTLEEYPAELAKVEAAIPDNPKLPSLYDFLQQEAAFSGLSLGSISAVIEQGERTQEVKVIPVTLELVGSYSAMKEFLSRLLVSSRFSSLQSLNIAGSTQPGTFIATVQLHAYSY